MKIGMPAALLLAAMLMFVMGVLTGEDEPLLLAMVTIGASLITYLASLRGSPEGRGIPDEVEARLKELEHRLRLTEGELELASAQIERLRAERDFDRELEAVRGSAARAIAPPE